jgi:hypothetical protein
MKILNIILLILTIINLIIAIKESNTSAICGWSVVLTNLVIEITQDILKP